MFPFLIKSLIRLPNLRVDVFMLFRKNILSKKMAIASKEQKKIGYIKNPPLLNSSNINKLPPLFQIDLNNL